MTNELYSEFDLFLYDAVLSQADPHRRVLLFSVNGAAHTVCGEHAGSFSVGAIGRLRLPTDGQTFAFQIYADQRLRRAPEIDDKGAGRWGWRIGERRFAVQLGILPGRSGSVVTRDTTRLELDIPREFVARCEESACDPSTALRAFIGDLCALSSLFERPREDGYSNRGSALVELANNYFSGAFGALPVEFPRRRKRRRRQPSADRADGLHKVPKSRVED